MAITKENFVESWIFKNFLEFQVTNLGEEILNQLVYW